MVMKFEHNVLLGIGFMLHTLWCEIGLIMIIIIKLT